MIMEGHVTRTGDAANLGASGGKRVYRKTRRTE